MILNGKGGITGCGLHEYNFVSVLFNRSIQYSWLYLNKSFLHLFSSVFVRLFVLLSRMTTSRVRWFVEGLLDVLTLSNFLLLAVHYTHINTHYVLLLFLTTYLYLVVQISAYTILVLLLTAPM